MGLIKKFQDLTIFKGRFTYLCLLKDKLMFKNCPSDERLLELKNKFEGRRCFIVALGPSLIAEDLDLIKEYNEYSFSVNRCYQMFDKTRWRPDCYFFSDAKVFTPVTRDAIFEMANEGIDIIYSKFAAPKGMPSTAIYYKAKYTDAILSASRKTKYKKLAVPLRFSSNAYDFIYDGHTCIHSILQLAYFMGFKEVYLLGADCGVSANKVYTDLVKNNIDCNISEQNKIGDVMIEDYASLKKDIESQQLDFKIFNATRGGRLEVFPRVDIEDLFKEN